MFFREKKSPAGVVLQLIQSFRNQDDKPRQRVIVSLGSVKIPESDRGIIADRISSQLSNQIELLPANLTARQASWVDRILKLIQQRGVRALPELVPASTQESEAFALDSIEYSHSTPAGAEILGLHAWDQLDISKVLLEKGLNDLQLRYAKAVVISRLVDAVAEHEFPLWLQSKSSLPDLLGEPFAVSHIQERIDRTYELFYKNERSIEQHLQDRQEALFGPPPAIFLCDLTNASFDEAAEDNEESMWREVKEKSNAVPLIRLAIAYSIEGMPLGHRIFSENQDDSASFPEVLSQMQKEWGSLFQSEQKPLVVMDDDIATAENLRFLRSFGYDYFVCEKYTVGTGRAKEFSDREAFSQIRDTGVFVKLLREQCKEIHPLQSSQNTDETKSEVAAEQEEVWQESVLYCYSKPEEDTENASHKKAEKRFFADVEKLRMRIASKGFKDLAVAERALERIRNNHDEVASYYELAFTVEKEPQSREEEKKTNSSKNKKEPLVMTLRCERKADENADLYEAYCLRSTRSFEDGSEMWHLYTELTHPESGFRCLKTDVDLCLGASPEGKNLRTQVFISILALHLLCYIKRKLKEGGYPALPWKTLTTLLSNHTYTTLSGSQGEKTYCLRKPGLPSEVQKKIYNIFGINIKELPRTRFEFSSPSK